MKEHDNGPRSPADRPGSEDERVVRLLTMAGPRPAVPPAVAAQVKAAARAEWQRAVAEHRQPRRWRPSGALLALAAALVLVLGGGLWRWLGSPVAGPVAVVELAGGGVVATTQAGTAERLEPGVELDSGTWIETSPGGTAARAALRLADGAGLRIDHGSRLRLVSAGDIELRRGAVYIDSPLAGEPLAIHTEFGVARDIGTQFEVRLVEPSKSLRIRVREGLVELDRLGTRHSAAAGEELALLPNGSLVRGKVSSHGPSWDWVLAALPAYSIDGRSVDEVLAWAAREGGWELRYATESVAELAAEIRIYGPPAGSDLEDTVVAALTGSGLAHRLDNGRLLVSELPAETE